MDSATPISYTTRTFQKTTKGITRMRIIHFRLRHWKNHGTRICPTHAVLLSKLAQFKVIQGYSLYCQSKGCWWLGIWLPLNPTLHMSSYSRCVRRKSCDLDLRQFKVIQGQKSWCQSIADWWFPIWPPLCPSLYLSRRSRYLMCNFLTHI